MKNIRIIELGLLLFMLISSARDTVLAAPSQQGNPEAEAWVLQKLQSDRPVADLAVRFPNNESARRLGADFIASILTEEQGINPQGIWIYNAQVIGVLDIRNQNVLHNVTINNSQFLSSVVMNNTRFPYSLSLSDSSFVSIDFQSIKISENFFLTNSTFSEDVNFDDGVIGNTLVLNGVIFSNPEKTVNFSNLQTGNDFFLQNAVFEGGATFYSADILGNISANNTQFNNPEEEIFFTNIFVEDTVFFRNTIFNGTVNFHSAIVNGSVLLNGSEFNQRSEAINFTFLTTGKSLNLNNCIFAGPVLIIDASIGGNLQAIDTLFSSGRVNKFQRIHIAGALFLENAQFTGPVSFQDSQIEISIQAPNTRFQSWANFEGVKIGSDAGFDGAVFQDQAIFSKASVAGDLSLIGAKFSSQSEQANFEDIEIGNQLLLIDTVFSGPVSFQDAVIGGQITANALQITHPGLESNLSGVSVENDSDFSKAVFKGPVTFRNSKFGNTTLFDVTVFAKDVNFENTQFDHVSISNTSWPGAEYKINLNGISYSRVTAAGESAEQDAEDLLALINRADYHSQAYTDLEKYYTLTGNPKLANRVFVEQKRRELREILSPGTAPWYWNLFLDVFVLYGKAPGRAFFWSGVFYALGVWVFWDKRKMEFFNQQEAAAGASRDYNPFWYSLDLFLPFVELRTAQFWAPNPDNKFARNYMRFHSLLGSILIPIALLAFSGVIK